MDLEKKTISKMVRIYCRGHHGTSSGLCPECEALFDYALCRLDRCPFGTDKPTCEDCAIHCYQPEVRDQIRDVMRYSGPRMLLRHPILTIVHKLKTRE